MPAEVWTDAMRMIAAGGIVAAVALPVGFLGWAIARRQNQPLLPLWQPWRVPWGAFEVVVAFVVTFEVIRPLALILLAGSGFFEQVYGPGFPKLQPQGDEVVAGGAEEIVAGLLRQLWAGVLALPVQLGLLFAARRTFYPAWKPTESVRTCPVLAIAVAAWAVITPLVLALNFGVNILFTAFDIQPESHQLTRFESRLPIDSGLFILQVCVAAPLIEEVVFRGVILSWLLGKRKLTPSPDAPTALRPWLMAFLGVMYAALTRKPGPIIFMVVIVLGLVAVVAVCKSKRRTASAIYSSAALFAAVHSAIWPSPIPLFLLGLGLGWLAVRTRSVLVPAIVHGLFNAVSAVFVLRGGAG